MKGTTKQGIGVTVMTTGALAVFNSFELYSVDPFWLGGAVTIVGVALGVLGWKLICRGRGDVALEGARYNDEQVARHEANLAGGDPRAQGSNEGRDRSTRAESSLEDPPDPR